MKYKLVCSHRGYEEKQLLFLTLIPKNVDRGYHLPSLRPYYTMHWVCILVTFVSKSLAKREQKASKTQAKRNINAADSRFCPTHSVIEKHLLVLGSHFGIFSRFSCLFLAFWIPTCWYHKHEEKHEKNARKIQNASETTHNVIRPLLFGQKLDIKGTTSLTKIICQQIGVGIFR